MKRILLFAVPFALCQCKAEKEIQVKIVDVQLVKKDIVHRAPDTEEQVFTWKTSDNISFISFEPITMNTPIGSRMRMMVKR